MSSKAQTNPKHSARRSTKPVNAISKQRQTWTGGQVVDTGTASYDALCKRLTELRQETPKTYHELYLDSYGYRETPPRPQTGGSGAGVGWRRHYRYYVYIKYPSFGVP